ncbi:uncharacterized protein [Centruroides vittatus]|uniref:uncharacterized protein n=1 Tax=Centruroides vittatus TaxID=120091 RepID=UPI00351000DD
MEKNKKMLQDNSYGPFSVSSTSPTGFERSLEMEERGRYFPRQLATGLGMAKILMSILLFIFGSIAIVVEASLSLLGGGMWSGMVVLVTGIFAIIAAKRPSSSVHVVSFLCLSILSMAATGMVIVFSATGLVNDLNSPSSYFVDNEGNKLSTFGEVNLKGPAIILNGILVVVATLDCLFSVACCVISVREACRCISLYQDSACEEQDSQARKERLINWLGQQALMESNTVSSASFNCKNKIPWHLSTKYDNNHTLLGRSQSSSSTGSVPSRLAAYEVQTKSPTPSN